MDIKVQTVHFSADKKLVEYINEKVSKLDLFYDNITSSEVYLRVNKTSDKENKISEVKIHIPGKELFAKKQCKTFEEGVALAVEAIRKQVEKNKKVLVY
ncbi:MAG: ribosome-associated translation inhibitor RaiA [Flavobacteriia bacterium]|nr:ribosome-associated translation inhibitor RaiA [Flavobacteriia bacterium]